MHLEWRYITPGNGPSISTSLTESETAELRRLAKDKTVLEIGSAYGYSSVVMALAGAEDILSIDPHSWCPGSGLVMTVMLEAYEVINRVHMRFQTSFNLLPVLIKEEHLFDVIFIDSDHSYDTVKFEATNALKVLKPGGVLACHDYLEICCCPDVKRALDEIFPDGPDAVIDTMAIYNT